MTVSMPGGECLQSTAFCTGLFGDSETLLAVSVMSASPGKVFGFEGTGHGLLRNARHARAKPGPAPLLRSRRAAKLRVTPGK